MRQTEEEKGEKHESAPVSGSGFNGLPQQRRAATANGTMWWFHFQLSAGTEPGARLAQVGNVTWYCHFNSFLQGELNEATCVCVFTSKRAKVRVMAHFFSFCSPSGVDVLTVLES